MTSPGKRYSQCDDTCTTDCGHCKGNGPPPAEAQQDDERGRLAAVIGQHLPRYDGADSVGCTGPNCRYVEWEPWHVAGELLAARSSADAVSPVEDEQDVDRRWSVAEEIAGRYFSRYDDEWSDLRTDVAEAIAAARSSAKAAKR